jgi:hypothetical protein
VRLYELAKDAGSPMPIERIYIQRLRLLFHVMGVQDKFMLGGILQNYHIAGKASWLHRALKISWMRSQVGDFAVPAELDGLHDPTVWEAFAPFAKQLAKTLGKAKASHMLKVRNICELHSHDKRQSEILHSIGWTKAGSNEKESQGDQQVSHCDECTECFKNGAALAVHPTEKARYRRIAMRRFAADAVCRACQRFFHTRPRLLRHLHMGTADCWVWHCRRYWPMTSERAHELDHEDKRKGVAMHQKGFMDQEDDRIWRECQHLGLIDVLALRQEEEADHSQPNESELEDWRQIGLLPPGKGGRETIARTLMDMKVHHVSKDTTDLERSLLADIRWEPCHDWVPRPLALGTQYFLIMFTGDLRIWHSGSHGAAM